MRLLTKILATCTPAILLASAGSAQSYWTTDWGVAEHHHPVEGYEHEYEYGGVDVDRESYEWEPGYGYHEQEWWDPSDWFDPDDGVDYEELGTGWYDGANDRGYYDNTYTRNYDTPTRYRTDYGWHYDTGHGYDYGWHYDNIGNYDSIAYDYGYPDTRDVDYAFDRQFSGEVTGLKRVSGGVGEPDTAILTVRTRDGATRTIQLGDLNYAASALPRVDRGERVVIGGRSVNRNGERLFKAEEIRTADRSYLVPEYEYRKRIEGRLDGMRRVNVRGTDVEAVVADLRTQDGESMSVLLGDLADLRGAERSIRPGTPVRVDGYSREVNGRSTFVVQDIKFQRNQNQQNAGNRARQQSQQRMQQQQRRQQEQRMQQQRDRDRERTRNQSAQWQPSGGWW